MRDGGRQNLLVVLHAVELSQLPPHALLVRLALHVDRRRVDALEHVLGEQREGAHLRGEGWG